jgi:hypothetical protein
MVDDDLATPIEGTIVEVESEDTMFDLESK